MNHFLRNLSPSEQVGLLFVFVFGVLLLISVVALVVSLKDPQEDDVQTQKIREFNSLLSTSWLMCTVFWVGWAAGETIATVLFGLVAFFALREFITLSPTRQGDHRSLVLAFFVVLPMQFALVITRHFDLVTVFIPVYVFLLLPLRMVIAGETKGFLRAAGTIHWGLMTTVFSLSHLAYLLVLPAHAGAHGPVRGEMLVFYLLVLTQLNDVAQFLWGTWLGRHQVAPTVSPNKTVEGLLGGVATTTLLAWALAPWFTPFSGLHAVLAGLLIGGCGFTGDVVISAIKRDIGVKDSGSLLPGHGGILDRLDSLTYTAPLFFHFLYYFYY